jgi:hypothetical protein
MTDRRGGSCGMEDLLGLRFHPNRGVSHTA